LSPKAIVPIHKERWWNCQ